MNSNLLHIKFWEYDFYEPQWLWLLLLVPIVLLLRFMRFSKQKGKAKFSRPSSELQFFSFQPIQYLISAVYILLAFGFSALIFAMAKPNHYTDEKPIYDYEDGIDIIISMDISGSMLATDFLPNRLEAAKQVAKEFIDGRKSDKIGFVVFEGEAYTACPATRNYDYLKQVIDKTQTGLIEQGTAIGTGLGTAVARLRSDSLTSKVIILLTDGENNRGDISPLTAAELAKNKNITVYTIGVGKEGYVEIPMNTPFGKIMQKARVNIDENLLTKMAEHTGGTYFRATDENSLRSIYQTIDEMETRKLESTPITPEIRYNPQGFLIYGLLALLIGFILEQIALKSND